jgi:hypothetical protein
MPNHTQIEKNAAYIDVRFYLNKETEVWTDDDGNVEEEYSSFGLSKITRKKLKNITEDEADDLGESFYQMDSYQIFFASEVPGVVSSGDVAKFDS